MPELASLGSRDLPKLSGAELLGLDRTAFETRALPAVEPPRAIEAAPRASDAQTEELQPEPSALDRAREAVARAEATVKYAGSTTAERPAARVERPAARPTGRSLEGGLREGMDRADIIALSFRVGQKVNVGSAPEAQGWTITEIDREKDTVTVSEPKEVLNTYDSRHTMTLRELAMRNFDALDEKS
jgi:hypothetical protein